MQPRQKLFKIAPVIVELADKAEAPGIVDSFRWRRVSHQHRISRQTPLYYFATFLLG